MIPQFLNEAFLAGKTIIKGVFHVAVNMYIPIFRSLDARMVAENYEQTHTHIHGTTTVT